MVRTRGGHVSGQFGRAGLPLAAQLGVGQLGFMTSNKQRWVVSIAVSILIHSIFCVQAVTASAGQGGFLEIGLRESSDRQKVDSNTSKVSFQGI